MGGVLARIKGELRVVEEHCDAFSAKLVSIAKKTEPFIEQSSWEFSLAKDFHSVLHLLDPAHA